MAASADDHDPLLILGQYQGHQDGDSTEWGKDAAEFSLQSDCILRPVYLWPCFPAVYRDRDIKNS